MRKKSLLVFAVLLIVTGIAAAVEPDSDIWWGSNYTQGNFIYGGTLSFEWKDADTYDMTAGFGVFPQVEMILYKPVVAGFSPIDFGLALRGHTGIFFRILDNSVSDPTFPAGLGILGTVHFGFKGFTVHFSDFNDVPALFFNFLSRFDYFVELGAAFDILRASNSSPFGFAAATGFNYFVNDHFMLRSAYTYWNGFSGVSIGGSYKIGSGQKTKDVNINLNPLYYQIYLARFYSLYWYSFYPGGFYFDDSGYREGQGTVWEVTSKGNTDVLQIEKALLKKNSDGSKWWKIRFTSDGEEIVYEFLLDKDYNLVKLRFKDADSGAVKEYSLTDRDRRKYDKQKMRQVTTSEYKDWSKGKERISVPAGTYNTEYLYHKEDTDVYSWWITGSVPGTLVKFFQEDSEDKITGVLKKITEKNRSELDTLF